MEYFPLTVFQQSIYETIAPWGKTGSYISFIVHFDCKLKTETLKEAVNSIIMKNDGLRIRLTKINDEVNQYVSDYKKRNIEVCDFSHSKDLSFLNEWMQKENEKDMILFDSDLYEFKILDLYESTSCFIKSSHIICDGWASGLIKQQIEEEYNALTENKVGENDNRSSFIKYIKKQLDFVKSVGFQKNIEYWMFKLRPPIDACSFKPDFNTSDNMKITNIEYLLPEQTAKKLDLFCTEHYTSILIFYLSIMTICLAKANSGNNVLLGTFFHNRMTPEEQKTIGHFATTLAVRIEIDQDMSFLKLIKQVTGELKTGVKHNYLSSWAMTVLKKEAIKLGYITNDNDGGEDGNANEFHREGGNANGFHGIDTVVSFEKYHISEKISYVVPPNEFFQLLLLIRLVGEKLILDFKYWITAFDKNEIEQLYKSILNITQEVLDNPEKKLSELVFELPSK